MEQYGAWYFLYMMTGNLFLQEFFDRLPKERKDRLGKTARAIPWFAIPFAYLALHLYPIFVVIKLLGYKRP